MSASACHAQSCCNSLSSSRSEYQSEERRACLRTRWQTNTEPNAPARPRVAFSSFAAHRPFTRPPTTAPAHPAHSKLLQSAAPCALCFTSPITQLHFCDSISAPAYSICISSFPSKQLFLANMLGYKIFVAVVATVVGAVTATEARTSKHCKLNLFYGMF